MANAAENNDNININQRFQHIRNHVNNHNDGYENYNHDGGGNDGRGNDGLDNYEGGNDDRIYLSPDDARMIFPYLNFEQFRNMCIQQHVSQPADNDRITQFYIRYIACRGQINDIFHVLENVRNNMQDNQRFIDFLNYPLQEFNHTPFIFTVIKWNTQPNVIQRLFDMGCRLDIDDHDGYFPEENIHNSQWINPFHNILQIEGVPHTILPMHFDIQNINQYNINIMDNTPLHRHLLHFTLVENAVRRIVGEQDQVNLQENIQHILNNPPINILRV